MDDNNLNYFIVKSLPRKHNYVGTFTADEIVNNPLLNINLNSKKDFFLSFIANTLETAKVPFQVGHWVAFIIFKSKRGLSLRYFDSLADTPRKYPAFVSWIGRIKDACRARKVSFRLDTMKKPIQDAYSKLCGLYAAYAIINSHRERQSPLKKIFAKFASNRKINDSKILGFLHRQWPIRNCHTTPIYNGDKMSLDLLTRQPPFCPKSTLSAKKCFNKCKCSSCCERKGVPDGKKTI